MPRSSEKTTRWNTVSLPLEYCSAPYRAERSSTSHILDNSRPKTDFTSDKLFNTTGPLEFTNADYRAWRAHQRESSNRADSIKAKPAQLPQVLWRPKSPASAPMSRYRQHVNKKFNRSLETSHDLHRWSVTNPHDFWIDLYAYTGCIPALPNHVKTAYDSKARFRDIPVWFPGHKINFAENHLLPNVARSPDRIALTGLREGKLHDPEHITWAQLCELVRIMRIALLRAGIKKGDVVAALMSNSIWIIVIFLAGASIGAIFTSISPDMGLSGCLSRLRQVSAKIVFADLDLASRGKRVSLREKIADIKRELEKEGQQTGKGKRFVLVPCVKEAHMQGIDGTEGLGESLATFLGGATKTNRQTEPLKFERVPTSHPLVILYSSGTTGPPKCIVSPHMSLLNYKKISMLHNSLGPESIVFQYSSTSWILWNVMMGHMTTGACLITFDGNPLYPDASTPLRIIEKYRATYWGTSPRYLLELEQQSASGPKTANTHPRNYDLGSLKMVTTTGAPLLPSQMQHFYATFPNSENIHLSSVAGGTDIASSWIASDPAGPVYLNEMQMWALGHDCDILAQDATTDKRNGKFEYPSLGQTTEAGELVCKKPIPSAPVFFWGDDEKKSKYMDAYFNRFPISSEQGKETEYLDVWAQHDLTTRNPATGGLQILGRSDTTLNPSGIRFGSSEIYHIIESRPLNTLISDSLCVGRRRKGDSDEQVFLFLIPARGRKVDEQLKNEIRSAIRTNLSPRHVPKYIGEIKEIPYTINGKKVENVVKKIISGQSVVVSSTITNPGCLKEYEQYANLEIERTPRAKL